MISVKQTIQDNTRYNVYVIMYNKYNTSVVAYLWYNVMCIRTVDDMKLMVRNEIS